VPEGVLFGSSTAHKTLRKILVEDQKLDAVISLPGGVFKPYAGVSTAILVFTKTNSGGTDHVWFYDVDADGMSLDDKRTELLPLEKLGPIPKVQLTADEHARNNLPDILARWRTLHPLASSDLERVGVRGNGKQSAPLAAEDAARYGGELDRPRTAQSFCVPQADIAAQGYDLSINRYKEVVHGEVVHCPPSEILASLGKLESEIQQGMKELGEMLR
jgi:type I restriction enzyme M protein